LGSHSKFRQVCVCNRIVRLIPALFELASEAYRVLERSLFRNAGTVTETSVSSLPLVRNQAEPEDCTSAHVIITSYLWTFNCLYES